MKKLQLSAMGAVTCALFLLPVAASARNMISTAAGCNNEFKGNKGAVKACTACVKGKSKYKKSIKSKGAWMCEGGGSGGDGEDSLATLKASKRMATDAGPSKPKALSKHAQAYATIKPGTFTIGSPDNESGREGNEGQANVTITRAFMMQTTEVTHGDWHFIMGAPASSYDKNCGDDCPVSSVTLPQVLEYLNALSQREGLEQCYDLSEPQAKWTKGLDCTGYRLPTEAEWEFAARGGVKDARYGEPDEIAWYDANSRNSEDKMSAHPVAQKKPNAYGLYDMLGNVSELVWDAYEWTGFEGAVKDPINGGLAQKPGAQFIVRGGYYAASVRAARAASRVNEGGSFGSVYYGFRPVRTVK